MNVIITRKEYRFVFLVAAAILLVTSLPYIFGYVAVPEGKQFTGLMQDVPDHGQYLAWWRSFQSDILVNNKLTPEPNAPMFFNLLWFLLGRFSLLTGTGYPLAYQILRFVAGFSLFWAVYRLIALFFADQARRRAAFWMVSLAAGFGWILIVLKYTLAGGETIAPLLIFTAEPNYFLCLLGFPHFALAATFICLVLEFIFRGWKENSIGRMAAAGGIAFVMGWMHAYDLLIIYGVTGIFFLAQWIRSRKFPLRFFWGAAVMAVLSVAPALYSYLLTSLDPLWKEVLAQFANAGVYTPMPPLLFFLFGVPLFLAVWALVVWFREKHWSDERLFIAVWFFVGFGLLYIPTDFQIHMLNSWQIPVAILAADVMVAKVIPALERRFSRPLLGMSAARWGMAALILLIIPTNLYLFAWRFIELARGEYPYYLENGYVEALEWLGQHGDPDSVVLSSLTIGQYVPALSGMTAYLAHWANTVDYYGKEQDVNAFYSSQGQDSARVSIAREFGVDYVVYGPAEEALGSFSPEEIGWVTPVFTSGPVTVYQVSPERLAEAQP
ncbi:MAG TPA: hypothetical protein VIO36_14425 [Anaerolineaceae bacterium]